MIRLVAQLLRHHRWPCEGCQRRRIDPRRRALCAACVKSLPDTLQRRFVRAAALRGGLPGVFAVVLDDAVKALHEMQASSPRNREDHTR